MTVHPHSALRPVEGRIWRAVLEAAETQARSREIDAATMPVRGAFLAWLLTEGAAKTAPVLMQLTLLGASIEPPFDLKGLRLTLTPRFVGCTLPSVDLRDATIVGFEVLAGSVTDISADRLSSTGTLAIRATIARDLVPEHYRGKPTIERQLRLSGAIIRGNLDLRGCTIRGEGQADGVALLADGLTVNGNALLSNRFKATGEVRLSGSRLQRHLDLSGAKLRARRTYSLFAKGSQISGSLYLCRTKRWSIYPDTVAFTSIGAVTVEGARIDGDLDCTGGFFLSPAIATRWISTPAEGDDDRNFALNAAGVVVRRDVLLGDLFWSKGAVCLINARIESDLQCDGGYFDYPRDDALQCDGAEVAGTTFFKRDAASRPTRTSGFINLRYGSFKQSVQIDGLDFAGSGSVPAHDGRPRNCGIDLSFGEVGGKLLFRNVTRSETSLVEIDLCQTTVDVLEDDESSWGAAAILNLSGCQYKAISDVRADAAWRLALLDRHYVRRSDDTPSRYFEPQPYLHLAEVMLQSGYDGAATEIRIHLEDAYTDVGDFRGRRRVWRHILRSTIAYGYAPSRAVLWLTAWALVSALVFTLAPEGAIIQPKESEPASHVPTLEFSPLIYAVDTLVPLVDLHQKSNWLVQPPSFQPWVEAWQNPRADPASLPTRLLQALWQSIVRLVGFLNPFIGWTLTSLFAAGVTGLVRRS
ncbi:MAG TPA: hypothetical protein VLX85_04735 [Stellaceae bacterium]|nr:hypothetical protein [Stellaceae bacterium]